MKKRNGRNFLAAGLVLAAFAVFTAVVSLVDVRAVGPFGSRVGFATINQFAHGIFGVRMPLYMATDWLSLVPFGVISGFALFGLVQWMSRKRLSRVDFDILALGGFYVAVLGVYLFFEVLALNYRPVLINGQLEASYPSSTTVLVLCVMLTAAMQFRARVKKRWLRRSLTLFCITFAAFMVIGRLFSGVHWLTDIVGGVLLSVGLLLTYRAICKSKQGGGARVDEKSECGGREGKPNE